MMLQALMQYAERRAKEDPAFADPDFEPVKLHWLIPLSATGTFLGAPIPMGEMKGKKRLPALVPRPATSVNEISVRVPGKAKSYFLCDTVERALCCSQDGSENSDLLVAARHSYFKRLLLEAAPVAPNTASAILTFLENSIELAKCRMALIEAKADVSQNCTFQVGGCGRSVLEDADLRAFWRRRRSIQIGRNMESSICLVTGLLGDTVETTEKVKGIGGQDTNLISANEKAFQSFGLEKSKNSPISRRAEQMTRAALDELISRSVRLGDKQTIYYLHWTREPVATDIFKLLESADEAGVANLLKAPKSGHQPSSLDDNAYYAMSLSGNGGRVVVRDWLESTVQEVQKNVSEWFRHLTIISPDGMGNVSAFRIRSLLASLVLKKRDKPDYDKLAPQVPTQLLYAALRGTPLPLTALAAALRRQQVEAADQPNPARFALIKACLLRSPNINSNNPLDTTTMNECLNPESRDPAYLCGRLFAIFVELQEIALGQVGAGVAERFYASACVTPALVMGRLFRNAQFHASKAEGQGGWRKAKSITAQKDFEEVSCALGDKFPPSLDLEAQGRFALGYYHQKADYRRRTAENKEKREAEATAAKD